MFFWGVLTLLHFCSGEFLESFPPSVGHFFVGALLIIGIRARYNVVPHIAVASG
jgi:hypothetical protein